MASFSQDAFSPFAFSLEAFGVGEPYTPLDDNDFIGELYDITALWGGVELTSTTALPLWTDKPAVMTLWANKPAVNTVWADKE